jgi:hypothetical protein
MGPQVGGLDVSLQEHAQGPRENLRVRENKHPGEEGRRMGGKRRGRRGRRRRDRGGGGGGGGGKGMKNSIINSSLKFMK